MQHTLTYMWPDDTRIETVARSLQARLCGAVDPDRIRAEVQAEFEAFMGARVLDFVPILVETRVRSRLRSGPTDHEGRAWG